MTNVIGYDKEVRDTLRLAQVIRDDSWVDTETVIINCGPSFSSLTSQLLSHGLSISTGNLVDIINLEMPTSLSPQIWDKENGYIVWDKYLLDFSHKLDKTLKYLFLSSYSLGGDLAAVKRVARAKQLSYKFATVYLDKDSIFAPDYFTEVLENPSIFEWENPNLR